VDEIMCPMQGTPKKAKIVGFRPLPMRMGVGGCLSRSWKTYRVPRTNTKVCLKVLSFCYFEERRNRILVHVSEPLPRSSVYLLLSIVVLHRFLQVASEPNPKRIDKFADMNDTIIASEFFGSLLQFIGLSISPCVHDLACDPFP
jgi:hypothetical protein